MISKLQGDHSTMTIYVPIRRIFEKDIRYSNRIVIYAPMHLIKMIDPLTIIVDT